MPILHLFPCSASTCPTRAQRCVRESFLTTLLSSFTTKSWKCSSSTRMHAERPSRYEPETWVERLTCAADELHEGQLTSPLLWPHFQEQMFVELNRHLSIVAG